jgi:hypothetical protein
MTRIMQGVLPHGALHKRQVRHPFNRRCLSETKQVFIVKEPKSTAGRRTITLPDFPLAALIDHKPAMLAHKTA